ncbi:MAG: ribonuclease P protein subunit [Thermoplasmata archaeon]|nr:ribonuclease P protein subunit [Thermoplasmata archaeon]
MSRPDRSIADALSGELLGAPISIHHAPGLAQGTLEGTVVDESMNTFLVRASRGGRCLRIPKSGLEATVLLGGREIPFKGDTLRVRPEDRTKRLATRGRRS